MYTLVILDDEESFRHETAGWLCVPRASCVELVAAGSVKR